MSKCAVYPVTQKFKRKRQGEMRKQRGGGGGKKRVTDVWYKCRGQQAWGQALRLL